MKLGELSFELMDPGVGEFALQRIEEIGRICYRSEEHAGLDSAKFVKMLIARKHDAMLEHVSFSVIFVCDRGVANEIVRHRIASYAQESTRFCNYSKERFDGEITFLPMLEGLTDFQSERRMGLYKAIESVYMSEIREGVKPQQARDNLPICLQTKMVMTANAREWRHFFALRTAPDAHPQMVALTQALLVDFRANYPVLFDDVGVIAE